MEETVLSHRTENDRAAREGEKETKLTGVLETCLLLKLGQSRWQKRRQSFTVFSFFRAGFLFFGIFL